MARGVAVAVLNLFAVNAAHQPTTTCHLERKEERSDDWSRAHLFPMERSGMKSR